MYILLILARKVTAEIIKPPKNSQILENSFILQKKGARTDRTSFASIKIAKIKFETGVIIEISPKSSAVRGSVNINAKKLIQRESEMYLKILFPYVL